MTIPYEVYYELCRAVNQNDHTTVERLIEENRDHINEGLDGDSGRTLLITSVGNLSNMRLAKRLLELPDVDVDVTDDYGYTALNKACLFENDILQDKYKDLVPEVMQKLIDRSSEETINLRCCFGDTPMNYCTSPKTAYLLLKKGANPFHASTVYNTPEVREFVDKSVKRIETFKYLKSNGNSWGMTSNQPTVAVKPASNPRDNNRQDTKPPAKRPRIFK